jgi:hypothetical protein
MKTPINRIDLSTKYKQNKITVATDMTYSHSTHPEARIAGAFDGSTNYWSGAFKAGTAGSTLPQQWRRSERQLELPTAKRSNFSRTSRRSRSASTSTLPAK